MVNPKKNQTFSSDEDEGCSTYSLEPPPKIRKKKSQAELRNPRQKYQPRWEKYFPWLRADKEDDSVGICTICNRQLVCKKTHMERHEKSSKHKRLLGDCPVDIKSRTNSQRNTTPEFLECEKVEKLESEEDALENSFEMDPDCEEDLELSTLIESLFKKRLKRQDAARSFKSKATPVGKQKRAEPVPTTSTPLQKPAKLTLYELLRSYQQQSPPREKNHIDLFFESVSSSVKALSPKLIAESKMRVSQLIGELELRALTENEAVNTSIGPALGIVVASDSAGNRYANQKPSQRHGCS